MNTKEITMDIFKLPTELKVELMCHLGSLQTLRELLIAIPSMAPLFNSHFYEISEELLKGSLNPRLNPYIYTIVIAHFAPPPEDLEDLEDFMSYYFGERNEPARMQPPFLPTYVTSSDIINTLEYMIQVVLAVKFFEPYASDTVVGSRKHHLAGVGGWELRTLRLLLRLQLHAELFECTTSICDDPSEKSEAYWARFSNTYNEDCKRIQTMLDRWLGHRVLYSFTGFYAENLDIRQHCGLLHNFIVLKRNPLNRTGLEHAFQLRKDTFYIGTELSTTGKQLVAEFEISSHYSRRKLCEKLEAEI